jgi:hypothetical protein
MTHHGCKLGRYSDRQFICVPIDQGYQFCTFVARLLGWQNLSNGRSIDRKIVIKCFDRHIALLTADSVYDGFVPWAEKIKSVYFSG